MLFFFPSGLKIVAESENRTFSFQRKRPNLKFCYVFQSKDSQDCDMLLPGWIKKQYT